MILSIKKISFSSPIITINSLVNPQAKQIVQFDILLFLYFV